MSRCRLSAVDLDRPTQKSRAFTSAFEAEVVDLLAAGDTSVADVAATLDVAGTIVRAWVRRAPPAAGADVAAGAHASGFQRHVPAGELMLHYHPTTAGRPIGAAGFDLTGEARMGAVLVARLRAFVFYPRQANKNRGLQTDHYSEAYQAMVPLCATPPARLLILANIKTSLGHRRLHVGTRLLENLLAWREWIDAETGCLLFVKVAEPPAPSREQVIRFYEALGFASLGVAGVGADFMFRPPQRFAT